MRNATKDFKIGILESMGYITVEDGPVTCVALVTTDELSYVTFVNDDEWHKDFLIEKIVRQINELIKNKLGDYTIQNKRAEQALNNIQKWMKGE